MDKKIGVVFDTNAYRNFVRDLKIGQVPEAVQKLREKENKAGIKAYSSVIVALELLGHLGENGHNFDECSKGILALGMHCFDEEKNDLRIIPDARAHIIGVLFPNSTKKEELELRIRRIGGVIADIRKCSEEAIKTHKLKGTFKDVENYINTIEKDFLRLIKLFLFISKRHKVVNNYNSIEKIGLIKISPKKSNRCLKIKQLNFFNDKNIEILFSYYTIKYLSEYLNQKNNENEIMKKAVDLTSNFRLSFGFLKYMLIKIVENDIDIKSKKTKQKRANWVWDYNISFHISNRTLDDRKSIIITSDEDMTAILRKNSYADRVMNLEEYYKSIKYK